MKKFKFFHLAILLATLMVSCLESETISPDISEYPDLSAGEITLKDGILIFPNREHYEQTFYFLFENQDDLKAWELGFPGFTSMQSAYLDIISDEEIIEEILDKKSVKGYEGIMTLVEDEEAEELDLDINIPLPNLATMVNKDGILQIGDTLYKYTYDKVIVVENYDSMNMGDPRNLSVNNLPKNAWVSKTSRSEEVVPVGNLMKKVKIKKSKKSSKDYNPSGQTARRIKGEIQEWEDGVGNFGLNLITKHKKRSVWIWVAEKVNAMHQQAWGTVELRNDFGARWTENFNIRNIGHINKNSISWAPYARPDGSFVRFNTYEVTGLHWCHPCDDGQNHSTRATLKK